MTQKEIKENLDKIEDIGSLRLEVLRLKEEEGISEKTLSKYINKIKKHDLKLDKITKMKEIEKEALSNGYDYVIGIDEVGRGPLAGPVVACATVIDQSVMILDVDDSKKLSEETRERLYQEIKDKALASETGMVSATVIDEVNILQATFRAMAEAYEKVMKVIPEGKRVLTLIDGNQLNPLIKTPQKVVIKGDSKVYSIACSSIVAKVTRDRIMNELHDVYPDYDFINNKGYGTAKHTEALREKGPIPGLHRETFIKNLLNKENE